jgi:hypothetical protein
MVRFPFPRFGATRVRMGARSRSVNAGRASAAWVGEQLTGGCQRWLVETSGARTLRGERVRGGWLCSDEVGSTSCPACTQAGTWCQGGKCTACGAPGAHCCYSYCTDELTYCHATSIMQVPSRSSVDDRAQGERHVPPASSRLPREPSLRASFDALSGPYGPHARRSARSRASSAVTERGLAFPQRSRTLA